MQYRRDCDHDGINDDNTMTLIVVSNQRNNRYNYCGDGGVMVTGFTSRGILSRSR